MKKTYELSDLDCANCAAKMQNAIEKISGVTSVSVNFFLQKLTIEADEGVFSDVLKKTVQVCKKIEPDCTIKIK